MTILDTSALIRFFTNDIPTQANKVRKIIDQQENLKIPEVVFPEIEYVLKSLTYNSTRENILTAFQFLSSQKNINISKDTARAIRLYEYSNLDMADCLIAASAHHQQLITFDKKLASLHKRA